MAKNKKPRLSKAIVTNKQPVIQKVNDLDKKITFHFGMVDFNRWPLHAISKTDLKRLLKRLKHIEQLSVNQARANSVIADYEVQNIPNMGARRAITEMNQDTICCIKIAPSEELRLYGVREINQIHILWWDPTHEIWNMGKVKR